MKVNNEILRNFAKALFIKIFEFKEFFFSKFVN